MIVKMKKVFLVILDSTREQSLEKLRKLGVVHIEKENKSNETLNALIEKKTLFDRSIFALPKQQKDKRKSVSAKADFAEAEKIAVKINGILEKIHGLEDGKEKDKKDILTLTPWGEFDPASVSALEKDGVTLKFYVLTKEQFAGLPQDAKYITANKIKDVTYIISVSLKGETPVDIIGEKLVLPAAGIKQLSENIKKKDDEIAELRKELEKLGDKKEILEEGLKELKTTLEFEVVNAEMNKEDQFSYLSGYVPANLVDKVKEEAAASNWALLIRDPDKEESPPTLIKNNGFVEFIKPLFAFLDVTPGYKEFDISFFFIIFFIPFVAMIVGDGGYGLFVLILTIILRIKVKNFSGKLFGLLSVLGCAIVAWGTITGNWFGSEAISKIPFIKSLTIPEIASFGETDTSGAIKQLAFTIGMVQLTLGIIISFIRKMPSLGAIADIGWLFVLYGMYFFAQFFVMGAALNPMAITLVLVGFVLLILFSYQGGKNIFKAVLLGLVWSPLTALNCVSLFADLVSYIRLFAVGLAGWAVASSFNTMAAGIANNGIVGTICAALIIIIAQSFNIVLCALSVIVHGVRLNMLEFGNKIGMEWSGHSYAPFKD